MEFGRAVAFEQDLQTFSVRERAQIRTKVLGYQEYRRSHPELSPPAGYHAKVIERLADGSPITQIYCGKDFRAGHVSFHGESTTIWIGVRRKSRQVDLAWIRQLRRRAEEVAEGRPAG